MKLMKRSLVLVVVLGSVAMLSAGCAFLGISKSEVNRTVRKILGYPDNPYLKPIPEAPSAYRAAYDHLEARRWSQAEAGFREFLKNQPTTNWTLAAQFNIGRSLEEQLRFAEALEKYREVEQKGQTAPKIQGLALVRMGVMLEALGEDAQSLAALKDAERRSAMMSREVAEAELPARLAAAYARAHNPKEAERYFAAADRALGRLRVASAKDGRPEWLARVLYAMGHRPAQEVEWQRFDEVIRSVERSQGYLVQAAELEEEPWASLAVDDLNQTYAALRKSIDAVPVPASSEILVAAREQQRQRWERLVRLGDAVAKLRSLFVLEIIKQAGPESDKPVVRLFNAVDQFEESLQATLMFERPVGDSATDESQNRRRKVVEPVPKFPGEGAE